MDEMIGRNIEVYERKVNTIVVTFSTSTLCRMLMSLQGGATPRKSKLSSLHQLDKLLSAKNGNFAAVDHEVIRYFEWFHTYIDYLRDLKRKFDDEIYTPLWAYVFGAASEPLMTGRETSDGSIIVTPRTPGSRGRVDLGSAVKDDKPSRLEPEKKPSRHHGHSSRHHGHYAHQMVARASPHQPTRHRNGDTNINGRGNGSSSISNDTDRPMSNSVTFPLSQMVAENGFAGGLDVAATEVEGMFTQINALRKKWKKLLDGREIDIDLFTSETGEEMNQFESSHGSMANIFLLVRLVPDLAAKSQAAADMAKRLLAVHKKISKSHSRSCTPAEPGAAVMDHVVDSSMEDAGDNLKTKINSLDDDITEKQRQLEQDFDDLQTLLGREERSRALTIDADSAEEDIKTASRAIGKIEEKMNIIKRRLIMIEDRNGDQYHSYRKSYNRYTRSLSQLKRQMTVHEYRLKLLREDSLLEMELKPEVIRITDTVTSQCEELERGLAQDKIEKMKLEKALQQMNTR